jgi:hypothetical protein
VDERAAAPVVGKAMEVAVLVVFLGVVSAALFGSVVPQYRTAAGAEIGDRVLVAAAGQVEVATDGPESVVERRVDVSLPRTIRGAAYVVRAESRNGTPALVLDHPNAAIGGETLLSVPPRVAVVDGEFRSTASPAIVVRARADGTTAVTLQ